MRTTLNLDDDVYEAARAQAATSGKPLGAIVSLLARRGLRPRTGPRRGGLPVFEVSTRAAIVPGGRASEPLAAEGVD
jgi:hypothetical protein